MRRDDVRRYCLSCSAETGRLVARICPSLDRERAEKTGRQEERRRRKADRDRESARERRSIDGVDLERELRRLARLPVFGGRMGSLGSRLPVLRIRRVRQPQQTAVRWSGDGSLVLAAWPGRSAEDAVAWLLWGVAALYRYRSGSRRAVHAFMLAAAGQAWPSLPVRGSSDTEVAQSIMAGLAASGQLKRDGVT